MFESLVSRIETLEAKSSSPPQQEQDNVSKREIENVYANIDNVSKKMFEFNMIYWLQSYVMDTNAKLTEVVFSIPAESMVDYRDIFIKKTGASDIKGILPVFNLSLARSRRNSPEPLDSDGSLDRPLLQRQTNNPSTDDLLKINVKPQLDVTNIADISAEEHRERGG